MLSPLQTAYTQQFRHHDRLIKVQLHHLRLFVIDGYSTHEISFNFDTYFSTESDPFGNMKSISVFGERVVHLAHPNPTVLQQWASLLHQNVHKVGFQNDYGVLEKIGEGVSAKVYLARSERGGTKVAVKVFSKIRMEAKDWAALKNQVQILRMVDSPYFPKLIGTYLTEKTVNLVLEYAQGINLKQMIDSRIISHTVKRDIVIEIAKALQFLHKQCIVHRDIKPENIIYNQKLNKIKIIDFGFSVYLPCKNKSYSNCGTPGYVAPQIFDKDYEPSMANDVFSLGVLIHYLFTKKLPFKQSQRSVLLDCKNCIFSFSSQLANFSSVSNIVKQMVCHQSIRITLSQLLFSSFSLSQNHQSPNNPQLKQMAKKRENLSRLNNRAESLIRERACSIKCKNYAKITELNTRINRRLITDRL